jgi:hypothetical protein
MFMTLCVGFFFFFFIIIVIIEGCKLKVYEFLIDAAHGTLDLGMVDTMTLDFRFEMIY